MIVKVIHNLGNRMQKIPEATNKDLEEVKSKQTMMNNTINGIKNSLEGINSRITEAEEWISDLEDKIMEIMTTEQNKEKRKKITQQMKEQGKNTPDLTNEEEIGSLPEKEFRVKIVKMIQSLGNRMEKI